MLHLNYIPKIISHILSFYSQIIIITYLIHSIIVIIFVISLLMLYSVDNWHYYSLFYSYSP